MKILISVQSSLTRLDRMLACRSTWIAKLAAYSHIRVLFALAADYLNTPVLNGDILYVPGEDCRGDVWRRTHGFLQWSLANTDADYIFKCDDDNFINADAFAKFDPAGRHYIGNTVDGYPGFLSGGSGYFLSRHAAELVVANPDGHQTFEDLNVGEVMTANGIEHSVDPRFIPLREMRPISIHYASPKDMYFLNEVM